MKYLLFSHGFGVKKDSRGMFTDIASAFPNYQAVMFDYNQINYATNEVTVVSYSKQAKILEEQINKIRKEDQAAIITLIGHSQGCIIPCLIEGIKINSAILLAPPKVLGSNRNRNQNITTDQDGSMRIPRKDGSTTVLTKSFIVEVRDTSPLDLYKRLATMRPTIIVMAKQDEILKDNDLTSLSDMAKVIKINGDHNFTGQDRKGLIKALSEYL